MSWTFTWFPPEPKAVPNVVLTGWQDIETAPRDGRRILGWDALNREVTIAHYLDKGDCFTGWFHWGDYIGGAKLSHWLPIPAPPEAP